MVLRGPEWCVGVLSGQGDHIQSFQTVFISRILSISASFLLLLTGTNGKLVELAFLAWLRGFRWVRCESEIKMMTLISSSELFYAIDTVKEHTLA